MPGDREQPILIRRFTGVDLSQDAAFLAPNVLTSSDSFVPNPLLLLAKRQGGAKYRQVVGDLPGTFTGTTPQMVPAFLRTYDDVGNRYAIVLGQDSTVGTTKIVTSLNDAAFLLQASSFTTRFGGTASFYSLAQLGGRVYAGNGVDPIEAIVLGSPVTMDTTPFEIASPAGGGTAAASAADSTASEMFPGTYSFAFAVYNSVTKHWTQRFAAQTFTHNPGPADQSIVFTSPVVGTYTLLANEQFHLFVAAVNRPIELSTDQTPLGVGNNAPTTIRKVMNDGTPLPLVGASRRGNLLFAHRNRLWVSGDQTPAGAPTNGSRVYASSIILPGLEQSIFDQQPYFPQTAVLNVGRQDGDRVTALGRAAVTVTTQSPDAPLLIFKNTALWAFFGDIFDDPQSQLVQLSAEIGCPAPLSIVETPIGTLFCGLESVYLVRPDQLIPFDIGFPIAPAIKGIPAALRPFTCAMYQRGFYKLAIPPFGGSGNTTEWWLDLRRAVDRSLSHDPSWWGPHTVPAVVAFSNARQDAEELDRALAIHLRGNISFQDQANVFTDLVDDTTGTTTTVVRSRLRTATFDAGAPFDRKTWTRLRAIARGDGPTTVSVNVSLDDTASVMTETLTYPGVTGNTWDGPWDGPWASGVFDEAESIFTADAFRAPHRTAALDLAHGDPAGFQIHDVELRYLPVPRPVA